MKKQFRRKHTVNPKDHHLGCMWGLLHILHYNRWRHAKRMLPHLRHGDRKHAPKVESPVDNEDIPSGRMQQGVDAEKDEPRVEETMTQSSPSTKNSITSRIMARTEEMFRWKGKHHRTSTFPVQSQVEQTEGVGHLETDEQNSVVKVALNVESPRIVRGRNKDSVDSFTFDTPALKASEDPLNSKAKCKACGNMLGVTHLEHKEVDDVQRKEQLLDQILQEKLDNARKTLLEQKLIDAKEHIKDAPLYQSKEFLDALDLVNLSKDLFQDILQDRESPSTQKFNARLGLKTKRGLSKSGSFPEAGPYERRLPEPSTLQSKLKERANHAKDREPQAGGQAQESADFMSAKDKESMPTMYMVNTYLKPNQVMLTDDNSPRSLILKNGSKNPVAMSHFKHLKQKLKHAIKESKKERHRITMDAVLHKVPYGHWSTDVKEIADQWKEAAARVGKDSPNFSPNFHKARSHHFRRSSSFDDSMDKYRHLYNSSFNRNSEHQISERLRLRIEQMGTHSGNVQKYLGRILSSPELKSYNYVEDDSSSGKLIRTTMNKMSSDKPKFPDVCIDSENKMQLDAIVETEDQDKLAEFNEITSSSSLVARETDAEMDFLDSDSGNLAIQDNIPKQDQEIESLGSPTAKLARPGPISAPDSYEELLTSPLKLSLLEEANQQFESSLDFAAQDNSLLDIQNVESPSMSLESDSINVQVDTKDEPEFNYVRYVLELSGFCRHELLGSWHAADRPVDPSVYDEMEDCFSNGPECSEIDEGGNSGHLILFDLINEVIKEIYEQSFSYYPMPLSSHCRIRPMPTGYHVLKEVWANISWYLRSRPDLDQSLDYAVSRDLTKGDGWMNLQFDSECVGLELEELIFDELLEEVIRCT